MRKAKMFGKLKKFSEVLGFEYVGQNTLWINVQRFLNPKKVKCPKEEKKEETKYSLAFHAEGKNKNELS